MRLGGRPHLTSTAPPFPRFHLASHAASRDPDRSYPPGTAAMERLISFVNKLQRACAALGDHGQQSALPTLQSSLPAMQSLEAR